jgi:hypothetical protein
VEDSYPIGQIGGEPAKGEAFPGQGRKGGIVEGQDAGNQQRREEKNEKKRHVDPEAQGIRTAIGQRTDHWTTWLSFWPVSLSPIQMMVDESSNSRKPKAAPWFQLKLAMNWL